VLDKLEVGAMHTFLAAEFALLWAAAVSFDAYCCEICFIGHMQISHRVPERTFQFRTATDKDEGKTNKFPTDQPACM